MDAAHTLAPSTLDKRLLARLLRTDCICTTSKGEFSRPTGDCWSLSARSFDHHKTPAARRLFAFVRRAPEEYISMSRSVVSHNLAVPGQTVFLKRVCWLCLVWRKLSTGCSWKRGKCYWSRGKIMEKLAHLEECLLLFVWIMQQTWRRPWPWRGVSNHLHAFMQEGLGVNLYRIL